MEQKLKKPNILARNQRVLKSVFLAEVVFLAISYNLRFTPVQNSLSVYEAIMAKLSTYGFKGNLYTVGLATLFWFWFQRFGDDALFSSRVLTFTGCLFGLVNQSALHLFYRDMLPWFSVRAIMAFLFQALAWAILFVIFSRIVLLLLEKIGEFTGSEQKSLIGLPAFIDRHLFFTAFLVIILGWMPWIISYYPASIEWDVYDPILRWLGVKAPSNHSPWFYTMIVGSAWQLGYRLGDKNIGMFLYILVRDLILAAIYARCIYLEKKNGLPRPVYYTVILFFAFTPVWGAYAKHAFKDTIAAGLFCWFIHLLIILICKAQKGKLKPGLCLEYSAAVLLGCLFRNNTSFIVVPISIVLAVYCLKKKCGIRTTAMLLAGVLLYNVYLGYLYEVLHVEKSPVHEVLSIPFQQTARTVKFHGEELTDEEQATLSIYWDYDRLPLLYDPIISDPVKNSELLQSETLGDYADYLKLWWKMGWKYPYTYLEALIAHSSGYYTFTPEYTEEQRYGLASHTNVGMTIFNWVYDDRFPDWLNCSYYEQTEHMRIVLDEWAELWHQIPLLNLTDMKPMYTWVIFLMGGVVLRRREYAKLLPVCACVMMILTCVGMPVNDCFRYYAPVAAAFPGLFMLMRQGYGEADDEHCSKKAVSEK